MTSGSLETRYRRLLRVYPADYRRQRGEEMLGTYLEMAGTGRRWPRLADVADLVAGSVRQRIRAAGPGLAGGLHAAAVLALVAAGALAAFWLSFVELTRLDISHTPPAVGPFRGLGGLVWLAWLAVAVAAAVSPGRRFRWAMAGALAVSVAVLPVAALTPLDRPALMALLPQVALGLVGTGLDGRAPRVARFAPLAAVAVTTAVLQLFCLPHSPLPIGYEVSYGYRSEAEHLMPTTGVLLAAAGLAAAVAYRVRGRGDGLWAVLVLVTPIALCFVEPVARRISGKHPWNPADFADLVTATVGLTVTAVVLTVVLRVVARRVSA